VKSFKKMKGSKVELKMKVCYFSLSPQDFFFSSFYLTSDTFIDWLSLDKEREKKTNFFVCN
jgi:hypothetical protein